VTIAADGIDAAALQEKAFHPKNAAGATISAWQRRANTIKATVAEANALRAELDKLKGDLASRPF
jgi:F0F1-type ATP synthase membrane subunit b/b'